MWSDFELLHPSLTKLIPFGSLFAVAAREKELSQFSASFHQTAVGAQLGLQVRHFAEYLRATCPVQLTWWRRSHPSSRLPPHHQQLGLDVVTQTNAIATRFIADHMNGSAIDTPGYEAFGIATLSSLSGLSSILVQKVVPREQRESFERLAKAEGGRTNRYGEHGDAAGLEGSPLRHRTSCADWLLTMEAPDAMLQGRSSSGGVTSLTSTHPLKR